MRLIKRIIVTCFFVVITLIILEGFLRVSSIFSLNDTKLEPTIGSRLKPNRTFVYFNEGFSIRETSNTGYYGISYPFAKGLNTTRICLLGDSYVQAIQVLDRHHFGFVLKDSCDKNNIKSEVLNFGRSGFDLNDSYCYYKNFIYKFNPTFTLVFISPGDLVDNNKIYNYSPRAKLLNNKLQIDTSYELSLAYQQKLKLEKYRESSVIVENVWKSTQLIKNNNYLSILFDKLYNPKSPNQMEKLNLTQLSSLNKSILKDLSDNNCIFVLHSETSSSKYNYLLDSVKLFFNKFNIKYIDLQSKFNLVKKNNVSVTYWATTKKNGHFNHYGHKVIGAFIFQELKSMGILINV